MFRNYLKIALRNLAKNKLYSAINIFGLMIGLCACLLIGVYISNELSYDKFNTRASRIVRAGMEYSSSGTVSKTALSGTKVGPQFKRSFPAVEEYVRTYISSKTIKAGDKVFEEPRVLFADPAFFEVFSFKLLQGDEATVLDAPDNIVIASSMSRKYFGEKDPVDQLLTIGNREFKVAGVFKDVPQNSQLKFDFVTQFLNIGKNVAEEQWWTANWITYFLLKDSKDVAGFAKQVNAYMDAPAVRTETRMEGADYLHYTIEPLTSVHLYSKEAGFEPNSNIRYIYMFGIIAILILVIACANYTNLATAQSTGRSAEIGMRKVMGASRKQVFFQFIGESSAITIIAAILSLALSALLIPYFNTITGKSFTIQDLLQPLPVLLLALFAVIVSFLAGAYPALVLSGTQIMGILKKGFNFTGTSNLLRKSLVVVQFSISVFLIIYTGVIMQQMNFLQQKNLGYDKDHVLVLPVDNKMTADYQSIKDAIANTPGIVSVTGAYETPEFIEWGDGIVATDEKGTQSISVNALPVDLDFTKTMKMNLVAGRDFQLSDLALMDTANQSANFRQPFLINETLAKKIGWTPEQAIGKTISRGSEGPIMGVVKDFNFESLHEPVKPLLIFLNKQFVRSLMVRVDGNRIKPALGSLEALWKTRVAHRPFEYHFLDEDYNKLYISEQRTASLFSVAAVLAIVLGCLGLFGLAAFTTMRRIKEIGIRRVLGANISSITFLVAKNFLALVSIAIVIAVPLAWYAGNQWLQDFAFRIDISVWLFAGAAILVILIALVTVSFQAIKAAIISPVKSLRSE